MPAMQIYECNRDPSMLHCSENCCVGIAMMLMMLLMMMLLMIMLLMMMLMMKLETPISAPKGRIMLAIQSRRSHPVLRRQ